MAVTNSVNREKSDQDPSTWVPANEVCRYISDWVAVKTRWSLSVDEVEKQSLLTYAAQCGDVGIGVVDIIG